MSEIIKPTPVKREIPYKSTVAIVLKNGVQVSSKSICIPEFLWKAFTVPEHDWFIIEVGDEEKNFMRIRREDISLISIMNYVPEEQAAKRSGLLVPDRSGGIRRLQ